ncbi:MAG: hypothetical protein IKK26_06925 [Clostridia bacterium]|nr:hypothetical protein [Clostridia bacterium]
MGKYFLQNRWKYESGKLVYYGLRNAEHMFKNRIRLNKKQARIIESLPAELGEAEVKALGSLFGEQVVAEKQLKQTPKTMEEATFCKVCCANNFIIPGLEFDRGGLCPMCQTAEKVSKFRSIVPLLDDIPKTKKSRFDVAVFYTGGKDSTFLLYYLAKKKGLRVLALTWEIPYMSDSAKASIENAKKRLENVEFISRSVSASQLKKIYAKLYELSGNTCACPSLAYVLFYPELVANKVPYFMAGNEPVQMLGLYYNHMAPPIAYTFWQSKLLQLAVNVGRVLTLRLPLRAGQFHTLATMKQLAYGDHWAKRLSGYTDVLVSNIVKSIHQVPELLEPLRRSIRYSSRTGNIPAFVHMDFDKACGGKYDWRVVKDELIRECGWVEPAEQGKALHTSCKIEKCKDHSQFVKFYNCQSVMIPFSAIEISLASRSKALSRQAAIYEMENLLGFSLEKIPECDIMCGFLREEK